MTNLTNQDYLRNQQYQNAGKLNARIALHERFSTNPQGWFPWIIEQMDLPPACHVLELGCGPGILWRTLLEQGGWEQLPAGWDVTLSDFSEGMLAQARHNLGGFNGFRFQVIDAQAIPFEAGRFDIVIANFMLYHVPDRPRALSEIRRVLKQGGCLYAATVGDHHMQELAALTGQFDPSGKVEQMRMGPEFSLENGQAQLEAFFDRVRLLRYPDGLHVTEAAPLIDYMLSTASFTHHDRRAEFAAFVAQVFAAKGGVMDITKDSGMFIAC